MKKENWNENQRNENEIFLRQQLQQRDEELEQPQKVQTRWNQEEHEKISSERFFQH